jgi:hypothetical protein
MTLAAVTTLRVVGVLGGCCLALAAAMLWVVFNEPVTLARVAYSGDLRPLLELLTDAVATLARAALGYL